MALGSNVVAEQALVIAEQQGLAGFLAALEASLDQAVRDPRFGAGQRDRLSRAISFARARTHKNPFGHPVALLYLVMRAGGRAVDAAAVEVATAYMLYVLALDLFDDVQDDDLDGKPYGAEPAPLAVNGAITLTFLAFDRLRRATAQLPRTTAGALFEVFTRSSITAAAGQERDLEGMPGPVTRAQVRELHQAKTSSVTLVVECGAVLGGFDAAARRALRALGEHLAAFVQIRDDLRDVFGRSSSPDLASRKPTYPMACLLELGSARSVRELERLTRDLPDSLPQIRSLFYEEGVVAACAEEMERLRRLMHESVAATGCLSAHLRTLLQIIDGLAASVYRPRPLRATERLFRPRTPFHRAVEREVAVFAHDMAALGFPPPPRLVPWHAAHWMFCQDEGVIFYPDIEGLPEEVLPFQARLLGQTDLRAVQDLLLQQLPAVVAHELSHFWRDAAGRMSSDHWHEEWAANRLAVAYLARFHPLTLRRTLSLADSVLERHAAAHAELTRAVLARCEQPREDANGYGASPEAIAVVTLEMVRSLARHPPELASAVASLVTGSATRGSRSSARDRAASRGCDRRAPSRKARRSSSPSSELQAARSRARGATAR